MLKLFKIAFFIYQIDLSLFKINDKAFFVKSSFIALDFLFRSFYYVRKFFINIIIA